jgi:hypothetical protein
LVASGSWGDETISLRRINTSDLSLTPLKPPIVFGDSDAPVVFDISADGSVVAALEIRLDGDVWLMEPPEDG